MKRSLSANNPFGVNRYGFLWETLFPLSKGKHLDYGTYDGKVLSELSKSNVIKEGIGVDLNINAINSAKDIPKNITLLPIRPKESKLPFDDNSFDSISILDVIEHIHNQKTILLELKRVLKSEGTLIITVPRKHYFSFLDLGNLKFVFPNLHKVFYHLIYSKEEYRKKYIECDHGLFGDIEKEKGWHQHFSEKELSDLLRNCGFMAVQFDGTGLFTRPLLLFSILFPFTKRLIQKIQEIDARTFASMNLFCVAKRR